MSGGSSSGEAHFGSWIDDIQSLLFGSTFQSGLRHEQAEILARGSEE
jgi:hypothetical protein